MSRWGVAIVCSMMLLRANGVANSGDAEVFRWVDERGSIHFTDNYQNVPERYRSRASHKRFEKEPTVESSAGGRAREFNEAPVVVNYYRKGSSILVHGLLNWSLPVLFHVDTGATITAITREDAQALGIQYEKAPLSRTKMADGRLASLPRVVLNSVKVGTAEVTNVEAILSNVRLLGLNFLSQFRVTVDSVNGQIIFERQEAEPLEESESIRHEKKRTVHKLEARVQQFQLAIKDIEKMIKQRESTIRSLRKKRSHIENQLSLLRQQKPSTQRDALLEEGEERLRMIRLSIEREDVAIKHHKKDIEIYRDNIDYYRGLIYRLR